MSAILASLTSPLHLTDLTAFISSCKLSPFVKIDKVECIACLDQVASTQIVKIQGTTQYFYCISCLTQAFVLASQDESFYPPRTCEKNRIEPKIVLPYLTSKEHKAYQLKSEEMAAGNRVYCAKLTCSKFLGKQTADKRTAAARCPDCHTVTCMACKQLDHVDGKTICTQSTEQAMATFLRQKYGYMRCPRCQNAVEKRSGCDHM